MKAADLFRLVADRYKDRPADYVLSLGHHAMPQPDHPVSIYNLPEFQACVSLTMREVREWAASPVEQATD